MIMIKSHLPDLYSILSGTITLVIVYFLKMPIKNKNYSIVYADKEKITDEIQKMRLRRSYQRRNLVIIALTLVIGVFIYALCAVVSEQIAFQLWPAFMSGLVALSEYAVIQQLVG